MVNTYCRCRLYPRCFLFIFLINSYTNQYGKVYSKKVVELDTLRIELRNNWINPLWDDL